MNYTFGAQKMEYNSKSGANTKTWESPKFLEGKKKAVELIDKTEYGLTEADFWILKTYSAKTVTYAGLIISHNGCLKINDKLAAEAKFVPSCVSWVRNGAGDLVLQYLNDKQGLLEFGEASIKNCTNAYPFAMVLKRLQDRVILKNSKIAFIVIDGMNYWQWTLLKHCLESQKLTVEEKPTLSWIPSITAWARQSIFGGKKPDLSIDNRSEGELFKNFWVEKHQKASYQVSYESS